MDIYVRILLCGNELRKAFRNFGWEKVSYRRPLHTGYISTLSRTLSTANHSFIHSSHIQVWLAISFNVQHPFLPPPSFPFQMGPFNSFLMTTSLHLTHLVSLGLSVYQHGHLRLNGI